MGDPRTPLDTVRPRSRVSIHAPRAGRDGADVGENVQLLYVSIHAPARGATGRTGSGTGSRTMTFILVGLRKYRAEVRAQIFVSKYEGPLRSPVHYVVKSLGKIDLSVLAMHFLDNCLHCF